MHKYFLYTFYYATQQRYKQRVRTGWHNEKLNKIGTNLWHSIAWDLCLKFELTFNYMSYHTGHTCIKTQTGYIRSSICVIKLQFVPAITAKSFVLFGNSCLKYYLVCWQKQRGEMCVSSWWINHELRQLSMGNGYKRRIKFHFVLDEEW